MLTPQQALVEPTRIGKVQGVMRGVTLGLANGMALWPHCCVALKLTCLFHARAIHSWLWVAVAI